MMTTWLSPFTARHRAGPGNSTCIGARSVITALSSEGGDAGGGA